MSDLLSQEEIDNLVAQLFEEMEHVEEKEPEPAKEQDKKKKASKAKHK